MEINNENYKLVKKTPFLVKFISWSTFLSGFWFFIGSLFSWIDGGFSFNTIALLTISIMLFAVYRGIYNLKKWAVWSFLIIVLANFVILYFSAQAPIKDILIEAVIGLVAFFYLLSKKSLLT